MLCRLALLLSALLCLCLLCTHTYADADTQSHTQSDRRAVLVSAVGFESLPAQRLLRELLLTEEQQRSLPPLTHTEGERESVQEIAWNSSARLSLFLTHTPSHPLAAHTHRHDCDAALCYVDAESLLCDDKVVERLACALSSLSLSPALSLPSLKATTQRTQTRSQAKVPLFLVFAAPPRALARVQALLGEAGLLADSLHDEVEKDDVNTEGTARVLKTATLFENVNLQVVLSPTSLPTNSPADSSSIAPAALRSVRALLNAVCVRSERDRDTLARSLTRTQLQKRPLTRTSRHTTRTHKAREREQERVGESVEIVRRASNVALQKALFQANASLTELNKRDTPQAFAQRMNAIAELALETFHTSLATQTQRLHTAHRQTDRERETLYPKAVVRGERETLKRLFDRCVGLYSRQVQLLRVAHTQRFNERAQAIAPHPGVLGELCALRDECVRALARDCEELRPQSMRELLDTHTETESERETVESALAQHNIPRKLTHTLTRSLTQRTHSLLSLALSRVKKTLTRSAHNHTAAAHNNSLTPAESAYQKALIEERQRKKLAYGTWNARLMLLDFAYTLDEYLAVRKAGYMVQGVLPRTRAPVAVSLHALLLHPMGLRDHRQDVLSERTEEDSIFFDAALSESMRREREKHKRLFGSVAALRTALKTQTDTHTSSSSEKESKEVRGTTWLSLLPRKTLSRVFALRGSQREQDAEWARELLMFPLVVKNPDELLVNMKRRATSGDLSYLRRDKDRERLAPERFIRWDISPLQEARRSLNEIEKEFESSARGKARENAASYLSGVELFVNDMLNVLPGLNKGFYRPPVVTYGPSYKP